MTHKQLQKEIVKVLTVRGNGFNIVSSNRKGRPDIIGHIAMIGLSIEVKVGRDVLRPAQRITLLDINKKGGIGIVVHEKHFESVFIPYIERIEREVSQCMPCNLIGKPIPEELTVADFEDVLRLDGVIDL